MGTKVLPLCKLKPLITYWEKGGGRREMDGGQGSERKGEKVGFGGGDLQRKIGEQEVN